MASTEMPRNARAFTAIATVAAGLLFGLAVWRATRPKPGAPRVPGALVQGRVVSEEGHGIEGLRVVIADRAGVTAVDGAFAIAGLVPGRHQLLVAGSGILPAVLDDVPAPAADVKVEVSRAVVLAGQVREGGVAAAGADVVASAGNGISRAATTDAGGAFRIEGLGEARYAVIARRGSSAALADGIERFGAGPFGDVDL